MGSHQNHYYITSIPMFSCTELDREGNKEEGKIINCRAGHGSALYWFILDRPKIS
jgi:hypothetical protein